MVFADQLKAAVDKRKADLETIAKRALGSAVDELLYRSPVRTGAFRGNWQFGDGAVNDDTGSLPDMSGSVARDRIMTAIASAKMGNVWYVSNSLAYAHRLEYDNWSAQAPGGMVRLTVQNFSEHVRKAVESVKGGLS